jgi:arylformamidase
MQRLKFVASLRWRGGENKARPGACSLRRSPRWLKFFAPSSEGFLMTIDYEAEYNNRARVPEHPEIFARWERDAAAYRTACEGRAELGISYGPTARQTIDLFHPARERAPRGERSGLLAVFIHGGYWRSLHPSQFSHMAKGLNAHGISVAIMGYDLCPQVKIADIISEAQQAALHLWRRFGRRFMVYGHSAGGHLAACLLATDWRALSKDAPEDLVPTACAISGVFDLMPLTHVTMNQELHLTDADARAGSPLFWKAPAGRNLEAWCGALESSEFRRQNRVIVEAWSKAGVVTTWMEVENANHFTVIDPLTDPAHDLTKRLVELTELTQ